MKVYLLLAFLTAITLVHVHGMMADPAHNDEDLYRQDFEEVEIGEYPQDFLVLDGDFAVQHGEGNQFLELPSSPLGSFGTLFGPTEREGIAVAARIWGKSKKRLQPRFGVGLNGVTGYKLWLSPGKRTIELAKDETVMASSPYEWKSGTWTHFHLQVRREAEEDCRVEAKVWPDGEKEPVEWTVSAKIEKALLNGRPSLCGAPYSDRPIRFDDLRVFVIEGRTQ